MSDTDFSYRAKFILEAVQNKPADQALTVVEDLLRWSFNEGRAYQQYSGWAEDQDNDKAWVNEQINKPKYNA